MPLKNPYENDSLTDAWTVKPLYNFNAIRLIGNSAIAVAKKHQSFSLVCDAYIKLEEYLRAICLRRDMLNKQKIQLNEIEQCLYGSHLQQKTIELWAKYNIKIKSDESGRKYIVNALNIVDALSNIFLEITEVAYYNNLIIPQPMDKKTGTERLEETMAG